MAELNEVVVAFFGEGFGPGAFVDEAFGAAAVEGVVDAGYVGGHDGAEALAPSAFGVNGGVADENDFDGAAFDNFHGFDALGREGCGFGIDVFCEFGSGFAHVDGDDAAEDVGALPIEVSLVEDGLAVVVFFSDGESVAFFFADLVEVGDAVALEVDERDLHFGGDLFHGVGVRE